MLPAPFCAVDLVYLARGDIFPRIFNRHQLLQPSQIHAGMFMTHALAHISVKTDTANHALEAS